MEHQAGAAWKPRDRLRQALVIVWEASETRGPRERAPSPPLSPRPMHEHLFGFRPLVDLRPDAM